jgi:cell shape-determining protein MreC
MNYLRPKKTPKYRQESFVLGAFLVVLLVYLYAPKVFITVADITSTLSRPLFSLFGALEEPKKDWQALFLQKKELLNSYGALEKQVATKEAEADLTQILLKERKEIGVVGLGAKEDISGEAQVLSLSGSSLYGTLLISLSQGKAKTGDLVISSSGFLLGRIVSGDGRILRLRLFSVPGEKLPVRIGEGGQTFIATGVGSGNFLIEAPREAGITSGDTVIAPLFVRLPVGVVEYTDQNPTSPTQMVRFQHPENIRTLENVSIIKTP